MSNFPDMVTQFGGCPVGIGWFPAIRSSAKVYFVDPASGTDNNDGLKPTSAMATVGAAYAKTVDKQGDIVFLLGDGSTTGTSRDTAITWSNSNTHLIGVTAPGINKRARIAPPTTDAADVDAYTPYITLSGSGCVFANFSLYQGQTEAKASVGILVSGSRNFFKNVDVITGASDNAGDYAHANLQITGQENLFEDCYIGQDTAPRGNNAISTNVRFGNDAAEEACRNVFRRCVFPCWADDTEPVFIYTKTAYDATRWNLFENCTFINTGTSTLAAGVNWADTTGKLFLQYCGFYGCTDVTAADSSYVFLVGATPGTPVDMGLFKGVDIA